MKIVGPLNLACMIKSVQKSRLVIVEEAWSLGSICYFLLALPPAPLAPPIAQ